MNSKANKSVVATADNTASSLRSGRPISAVPHFNRSAKVIKKSNPPIFSGCADIDHGQRLYE